MKPNKMPLTVASIEPKTDIAPLMPQIHGMLSFDEMSRMRMAEGNGMPMKKPNGKRSRAVVSILIEDSAESKAAKICGSMNV